MWRIRFYSWLNLYVSLIPAATSTFSKLFSTRYYALPTELTRRRFPGGGGTLGITGWGCAARTLEPLTYARATSAKFCYPILE